MEEFDKMNAEQIRKYLEKNKPSLEKARDIYSHEANNEMGADVMAMVSEYLAGLVGPEKKAKAQARKGK